jgi:hypothetical protein
VTKPSTKKKTHENNENKLHNSKNGVDKIFINDCGGNVEHKEKPEANYKANIKPTREPKGKKGNY